jgi:hypothetical protein
MALGSVLVLHIARTVNSVLGVVGIVRPSKGCHQQVVHYAPTARRR